MWQNLTFTQIKAVLDKYEKNNRGWWAWLSGVSNMAPLLPLRQFITDNIGRADEKLTNEDKIQFIQILANIKEEIYGKPEAFALLYRDLWHNEFSHGMRELLCAMASSPQFNWEVLTALQTNSIPHPSLATQPVAPSEHALTFVRQAIVWHLQPQNAVTPLYLRWCIAMGESLLNNSDDYSARKLLESLLKVPAPYPFLMDSICRSPYPRSATADYIKKAKALQQLTAAELEEIKNEANPLEAALFRLEIKSHPELDKPEIREHLRGVTITSELLNALPYLTGHGLTSIRAIIHSAYPLRLAQELKILQNLAVGREYQDKFLVLEEQLKHRMCTLYEISSLTKEYCELIIDARLNDHLIRAIACISPDLLTHERCKTLALKQPDWFCEFYNAVSSFKNQQVELEKVLDLFIAAPHPEQITPGLLTIARMPDLLTAERYKKLTLKKTEWFNQFHQAVLRLKDQPAELEKVFDLLIESPHPDQMGIGSTALIQAKLFNATGLSLLKTADKVQKITPISSALQGLEAAKLLTDNMVAALFKEVSPQPTPVSEECLSLRATG